MQDDNRPDTSSLSQGERLALWAEILEMTEEMQHVAQRGDWQTLDDMSGRREEHLRKFFATPVPEELQELVKKDIRHIQEIDAEVVHRVQKSRALLTDEITRLQAQKKRIKDYLSNSA